MIEVNYKGHVYNPDKAVQKQKVDDLGEARFGPNARPDAETIWRDAIASLNAMPDTIEVDAKGTLINCVESGAVILTEEGKLIVAPFSTVTAIRNAPLANSKPEPNKQLKDLLD